jgi:hypothetical protein
LIQISDETSARAEAPVHVIKRDREKVAVKVQLGRSDIGEELLAPLELSVGQSSEAMLDRVTGIGESEEWLPCLTRS